MLRNTVWLLLLLAMVFCLSGEVQAKSVRGEYYEGRREIAREKVEMRRNIMNSGTRWEARQAWREGQREIRREKREMRREMTRSYYRGW